VDRRSFIKLTAISGTSAALASCGTPEHQLIRFVPDEDIVPGIAEWRPSVCPLCPSGCGLTVRVMDADADVVRNGQAGVVQIRAAKKLEGAPAHPVNGGRLCARGQAAIQVTYHPDRITQPLRRAGERGDGQYEALSWDEALTEIVTRLDALADGGAGRPVAWVSRRSGGHRRALIDTFLGRFGAAAPVVCDPFDDEVLRRANGLSFGREQLPTFDLANARFVIAFGADFLGTWNSPVAQGAAYGAMRQGRQGIRGTFVQVESRMSQTGANADEWVPVRPGTDGVLALGLAHVILRDGARPADAAGRAGTRIAGWQEGLSAYAPEEVERITSVSASRVERLARSLIEAAPAVALIGGAPLAHTNGLFSALAVNALNGLLGSVDRPGGLSFMPQVDLGAAAGGTRARRPASMAALTDQMLAGGPAAPQMLFVDGANPVYATPPSSRIREALLQVPFIVSFGSFLDETSILADLILPDHSFLETWVDAAPESGAAVAVLGAAPPVMRPLHDTRPTPDVLLDVSRRLGTPLDLPWQSFEEMLAATFAALPATADGIDAWSDAQEKGGWWGELPARMPGVEAAGPAAIDGPLEFAEPRFDGDAGEYPLHFLPYASAAFLDGSLAHLPWLQEMPDPMTSAMWSSWVEINPSTAGRLGIGQGDVVEIASTQGVLRSAAVLSPGIAPDVVAMPAGQGHRTFTRYASGRGGNPFELLAPVTEPATGALAWAATRVRVSRVGAPDGRLILFAGGMREHEDHGR
jgi:anaerobic selenocysteine-containing dehydrogenase